MLEIRASNTSNRQSSFRWNVVMAIDSILLNAVNDDMWPMWKEKPKEASNITPLFKLPSEIDDTNSDYLKPFLAENISYS